MNANSIKIAVASKDGISINLHFGHATHFVIYQVDDSGCQQLDSREVSNYCLGEHADADAMTQIMHTISDCQAIMVAKIGDGPTQKLKAIGIEATGDYAYQAIEESLLDYAKLFLVRD